MPNNTISSKAELIHYLEQGCKPQEQWRVGIEFEKFGYQQNTLKPLDYHGVEMVLKDLQAFGWEPILENGHIIALMRDNASVTLEPGGQLELSGAPLSDVHEVVHETETHMRELHSILAKRQFFLIGHGFQPRVSLKDVPHMPKDRYTIMRSYMPKKGALGLEMMHRTSTAQVNCDFSSEQDMAKKFRVSMALQPIVTALFANSPFKENQPNGYLSYRSHVWTQTDNDRSGILPFAFDDSMSFERYVDYILDVPMYFIKRDGHYIDASGQSFKDFLKGQLPALKGELPTLKDFADHLTTAFPEVRLKHYLEMRGADAGPLGATFSLAALFVGLLYSSEALEAAYDLVKPWSFQDVLHLRQEVPKTALKTHFKHRHVFEFAKQMVDIAELGLKKRGLVEEKYLSYVQNILKTNTTHAEKLLTQYNAQKNLNFLFDQEKL